MVVHVTNLVCDYLFAKRVMASARLAAARGIGDHFAGPGGATVVPRLRREDVVRLTLPYVPPAATTMLYVVVSLMTLVDGERWGKAMYFSIGLNRLAPLVETACFYLWSVGHTRVLLKALSLSQTKSISATHLSIPPAHHRDPPELDLALAIQLDSYYAKSVYAPSSPNAPPAYAPPFAGTVATVSVGTVTTSTVTVELERDGAVPPIVQRAYTPPQRARGLPRSPQPQVRMHF
ncbi:hypothetical protein BCR44DRAFT_1434147 [Catenaria anguillulae PL171]|uniref:Uncharacterized protein n=1 Tax=Catenaria anguillulae PL171 TaxID=765915 RepID=A0A1Y2HLF5_9FUNG|nr:hypothetical protein BCR44DRAFT_1434147 [Catenaria anguillulae PL171]